MYFHPKWIIHIPLILMNNSWLKDYWLNNLIFMMATRPGKRLHNELENHHAIFMGKSTISTGPFSIAF